MKYIIDIEKIEGTGLYKAKGANTLVFDQRGIDMILKPYEEQAEHDGCEGCKYEKKDSREHPCCSCKGNFIDKYEKKTKVDWSKVSVDTPIIVKDTTNKFKFKRYFSHYENGKVYAFEGGQTSWSGVRTFGWEYAELAEEQDD